MSPKLQSYVTAFHRAGAGHRPDPAFADFAAAFRADPALVTEAKAELTRLSAKRGGVPLVDIDHETKTAHRALTRMLQRFDEQGAQAA